MHASGVGTDHEMIQVHGVEDHKDDAIVHELVMAAVNPSRVMMPGFERITPGSPGERSPVPPPNQTSLWLVQPQAVHISSSFEIKSRLKFCQ